MPFSLIGTMWMATDADVCDGNGEGTEGAARVGRSHHTVIPSRRQLLQETGAGSRQVSLGPAFRSRFGDRRQGGTVRN
jgi:hypothetical protein